MFGLKIKKDIFGARLFLLKKKLIPIQFYFIQLRILLHYLMRIVLLGKYRILIVTMLIVGILWIPHCEFNLKIYMVFIWKFTFFAFRHLIINKTLVICKIIALLSYPILKECNRSEKKSGGKGDLGARETSFFPSNRAWIRSETKIESMDGLFWLNTSYKKVRPKVRPKFGQSLAKPIQLYLKPHWGENN
jgi:hypothetical protein